MNGLVGKNEALRAEIARQKKGSNGSLIGEASQKHRLLEMAVSAMTPVPPQEHSRVSMAVEALKMPIKHKAVFVDAKAMKEKLRANMHKPRYDVTNFYKQEGWAQSVARDNRFEQITLSIISFNAFWIAIDCDGNDADVLSDAHPVFILAENFFCLFFTLELLIRFFSFANKFNCLKDSWFVFDTILVAFMIFETWIMTIVLLFVSADSSSGIGNASLLRLLRLLRLSRMARMARLLRSMPELLILIKGMVAAIRSVFFTLLLLVLLLYVWAIFFRQLTADSAIGEVKFPDIVSSAHTLVLDGMLHDGPGDLVFGFIDDDMYPLVVFFYIFVLQAAFTVLNMLIGVLCEVVSAVAGTEHEELTIVYVKERLQDIIDRVVEPGGQELFTLPWQADWGIVLAKKLRDLKQRGINISEQEGRRKLIIKDAHGNTVDFTQGRVDSNIQKERFPLIFKEADTQLRITKEKFLEILADPSAAGLFSEVGIDVFGVVDLIDTIFATESGTDRVLSFGDLVEVMMDQRNSNQATVKDVTDLRKYIRGRIDRLEAKMETHLMAIGSMVERALGMPVGAFMLEAEKAKALALENGHPPPIAPAPSTNEAKAITANVVGKSTEQPDLDDPQNQPTPPSGFGNGAAEPRLVERYSITRTEEKVHEVWEQQVQKNGVQASNTTEKAQPPGKKKTAEMDSVFEEGTDVEPGAEGLDASDVNITTKTTKKKKTKKRSMKPGTPGENAGFGELLDEPGEETPSAP